MLLNKEKEMVTTEVSINVVQREDKERYSGEPERNAYLF